MFLIRTHRARSNEHSFWMLFPKYIARKPPRVMQQHFRRIKTGQFSIQKAIRDQDWGGAEITLLPLTPDRFCIKIWSVLVWGKCYYITHRVLRALYIGNNISKPCLFDRARGVRMKNMSGHPKSRSGGRERSLSRLSIPFFFVNQSRVSLWAGRGFQWA